MNNTVDSSSLERVNLTSSEVAFAILKKDDSPEIGVYIPTLMSEIDMGDTIWESKEVLNNRMIANKDRNFSFDEIKICNYYMVEPYDPALYYTETRLGEQVRIKFRDNDIKQCFYYDDTYKMTDFLMDEILKLQKEVDELNSLCEILNAKVNYFEGEHKRIVSDNDIIKEENDNIISQNKEIVRKQDSLEREHKSINDLVNNNKESIKRIDTDTNRDIANINTKLNNIKNSLESQINNILKRVDKLEEGANNVTE